MPPSIKEAAQQHMTTLTYEECTALLKAHAFGRLAVDSGDGPLIFPMNYVYDGDSVIMRTSPGTKLMNADMTTVAFEIDGVTPGGVDGWSVVVRGPAHDVTTAIDESSEHTRRLDVDIWAPGEKHRVLRITARELTGRRFGRFKDDDSGGLE